MDSLWLGVLLSCREFTPDQEKKLFLQLLWSLVSVRQRFAERVQRQSTRWRLCGTSPALTRAEARGKALSPGRLGSPARIAGSDRLWKTESAFLPTTCPKVLPICQSLWLKCYSGVRRMLFLFLQHFFHLFSLRMITFGFVSARYVCMYFLFAGFFIWLECNCTFGSEIPNSKCCLFAFSSICMGTQDSFPGEHFFSK